MGPSARRAAQALAAGVGGHVVAEDAHAFAVRGSDLGDLAVELDLRYAHPQRHGMTLPVRIGPKAAAGLGWLVSGAVPRELIVPPLPVDRLAEVDRILGLLRAAGAHGRGATVFGSLGLHFNIDAPAADLPRITAVMLAFGLMELRLRREIAQGQPRLERHLPPAYPPEFLHRIAAPGTGPARPGWSTTTWPPTRRATAAWTCCRCCWGWTRRGCGPSCPMRRSPPARCSTSGCPRPIPARAAGASRRIGTAGWRWSGWRPTGRGWPPRRGRIAPGRGLGRWEAPLRTRSLNGRECCCLSRLRDL